MSGAPVQPNEAGAPADAGGPAETLVRLRRAGVVAVLRGPDAERTLRGIDALVAGGVGAVEVTFSTPDTAVVIEQARAAHGDNLLVGAGTIRTSGEVEAAFAAGAEFLVSPGTRPEITRAMLATGRLSLSGALTPSEVMLAAELGVHVIKLFPAALGGPAYLRSLRGPFADIDLVPTGGVSVDNLADWLSAGAPFVGAGRELCSTADLAAERFDVIEERARRFVAAARAACAPS